MNSDQPESEEMPPVVRKFYILNLIHQFKNMVAQNINEININK